MVENPTGTGLVAFGWCFFALALLVIGMRIWTRVGYLKDRMQLHDWLMVIAICSELIHVALLQLAVNYGLGMHIEEILATNPHNVSHIGHINIANQSFSVITSYFGRISFSVFLLSVIGVASKKTRYVLWAVIVVDTIVNAVVVVQIYAQCGTHLAGLWDQVDAKYCENAMVETYIGYVQASINSLCDLILTILPITIVAKLNMPRSTKIALGGLLALSSFALIASIAKAVEIRQLSDGDDFTYSFATLQFCVIGENDIVMIAASIPMLRALWIKEKAGTTNEHYNSHNMKSSGGARSKNVTQVATANRTSLSDDEEHMLGDLPKNGIQRTVGTVQVVESNYFPGKNEPDVDVRTVSNNWS